MELAWSEPRGGTPAPLSGVAPPAARLVVTPRRAGAAPEVVAVAEPRLFEQTDYRVVARATAGGRVRIAHRDPVLVGDLSEEDGGRLALGYVNFGSQVGRSEFAVFVDGVAEFDLEVEVFPTKLDYVDDYERIVELAGLEDLRSLAADAFASLSPEHREALQLRVIDECPYTDVAVRLGITEQTARARVSRALRRLAELIEMRPRMETRA